MNGIVLLLITVSAFIYALPFWYTFYCWWVIFLFPLSFFYMVFTQSIAWIYGYVWGTLIFLLPMIGVFQGLAHMSASPFLFCFLPFLCCVLYQGIFAGLLFFIVQALHKGLYIARASIISAAIWVVGLWCYFLYIERMCLMCFGRVEGYMLMSPLLPLVEHAYLLRFMPYIGKSIMLLLFYVWAALIALWLVHRHYYKLFVMVAMTIVCIGSAIYLPRTIYKRPAWLDRIVPMQKWFSQSAVPVNLAHTLAYEMRQLLAQFPHADVVIMPESAILDTRIVACDTCVSILSAEHIKKPIHVIVGSFAYDDQKQYRNTCYWIYDGRVQMRYDKRHAMPLTERIPSWCNYECLHDLYFSGTSQITPAQKIRPLFALEKDCIFVPYICSELFFNEWPDADDTNIPIIALVNDRWCPALYIRRLLFYLARFKAIQWQRDILYISYHYAVLCDKYGGVHQITTLA